MRTTDGLPVSSDGGRDRSPDSTAGREHDGLRQAPAVLIVDDDAGFRRLARILLLRCGLRIAGEASDGAEARRECERLRPHAVLLDVNLPDDYGPALARELRASSPGLQVLLTSSDPLLDGADGIAFLLKTELPAADLARLLARY